MTTSNERRWLASVTTTRSSRYIDVDATESEIWSIFGTDHINPFVFQIHIDSYFQMFKVCYYPK